MVTLTRQAAVAKGWRAGSHLENRVALLLSRWRVAAEQEYRVGAYQLDFAWPRRRIGLEADGFYHRLAEVAARDRVRDSWLRSQGWLIFRVDDDHGEDSLVLQVLLVVRVMRSAPEGHRCPGQAGRAAGVPRDLTGTRPPGQLAGRLLPAPRGASTWTRYAPKWSRRSSASRWPGWNR